MEQRLKMLRRSLIYLLVSLIFAILFLDALLFWIDPLGVVAAQHAMINLMRSQLPHETGYRLEEGDHWLHNYTMTLDADGNRITPQSNPNAECTIAAIGDSVTVGIGVNDEDTWVNLLAMTYPDIHWINTGRSNYSAPNVQWLQASTPADGYVWIIIDNDNILPQVVTQPPIVNDERYPSATRLYYNYLRYQFAEPTTAQPGRPVDNPMFYEVSHQILDRADTIAFAFDVETRVSNITQQLVDDYDNVYKIPWYAGGEISVADRHPNPKGHRLIAEALEPMIGDFADRICNTN